MSLRLRIFIIVIVAILVITGITLLVLRNFGRQNTQQSPTSTSVDGSVTVIDSTNFNTSPLNSGNLPVTVVTTTQIITNPVEATKTGVRQFAKVFVERWGTYSSDTSLQNIRDVEVMVTKNLLGYLNRSATGTAKNQSFVGVTTRVITTEMSEWTDTAASVKVQIIRTEERGTQTATSQQSGTVKLVKQGERWLVDGIFWDK